MQALDLWSNELAEAFRSAGPDVTERSVFGGSAFLVGDALIGMVENVSGQLRTRFRADLRSDLEPRSHFDPQSPLPMLLIVTEDDRDYVRGLIPKAYERAKQPAPEPPPPVAAARSVTGAAAGTVRRRRTR
jgi:hypothetical protein